LGTIEGLNSNNKIIIIGNKMNEIVINFITLNCLSKIKIIKLNNKINKKLAITDLLSERLKT
jgi:hypothetical protein